jgi:transcriptional regulator with XRE-family HTH domain
MESAPHGAADAPNQSSALTPRNLTGSKIRSFRESRKWSQADLATELRKISFKISRDIIASIETQRSPVTDWQLAMFAKVFSVSFDSFFPDMASLEQITAKAAATAREGRQTERGKDNRQRNFTKLSADWKICELSCKSLKMVLRRD